LESWANCLKASAPPERSLLQLRNLRKREKSVARSGAYNGGSSNGRTADSDSVNLGSNPSPPANDSNGLRLIAATEFSASNRAATTWQRFASRAARLATRQHSAKLAEGVAVAPRHGKRTHGRATSPNARSNRGDSSYLNRLRESNAGDQTERFSAAGQNPVRLFSSFRILGPALKIAREGKN
jgi:hypothetical protein